MNLFAYGTLIVPDILREVAGEAPRGEAGRLEGYRRGRLRGKVYPGIIECDNARVDGVVYFDLSPPAWELLDRFEGDLYRRTAVKVRCNESGEVDAWAYVLVPSAEALLGDDDWDLDRFLKEGRNVFCSGYEGFDRLSPPPKGC